MGPSLWSGNGTINIILMLSQDELENLGHIPGVDPLFLTPSALLTEEEPVDRNIPESTEPDIKLQDLEGGEWLPLVPPLALFKLPHRHPMEVFVSSLHCDSLSQPD